MKECLFDAFTDSAKALIVLFPACILMELLEHADHVSLKDAIRRNRRISVVLGALMGLLPQCGFSVAAASLYAQGLISLGTLTAVFVSTSDEAALLMVSEGRIRELLGICAFKFVLACIGGYLADRINAKKESKSEELISYHEEHCEHGILLEALRHCGEIFMLILLSNFLLNIFFSVISDSLLSAITHAKKPVQILVSSLIGLIPGCGPSIFLSELFFRELISLGAYGAGLCSATGLGILTLWKEEKSRKKELLLSAYLLALSLAGGFLLTVITK